MGLTDGVPGFDDTFFGPQDKNYMDRLARDMVKIRGINVLYFKKKDVPARIDGNRPLSDNPNLGPFDTRVHKGNALYAEPVIIGTRIDSTQREVTQAWDYDDPLEIRGVATNPQQSDTADERGHIEVRKLVLFLARAMCDEANLVPQIDDIVKMPTLLHDYYDIELMRRDNHRFGGTGFFTSYELNLVKSSKFPPQRKDLPGVP